MKELKQAFERVVNKRRDINGCSAFVGDMAIFHHYVRELEKQNKELLALDKPWPLKDVIAYLVKAADILLNERNYDGHSHEELNICLNRGKEILIQLSKTKD